MTDDSEPQIEANHDSGARRRRLVSGVGSRMFGQFASMIVRFLEIPVLLWAWGAVELGQWLLISSVPSLLASGDLGFTSAGGRQLTGLIAQRRITDARNLFWTLQAIAAAISGLAALAAMLIAWLLFAWGIVDVSEIGIPTAVLIVLLLSLSVTVNFSSVGVYAAFESLGRYGAGFSVLTGIGMVRFLSALGIVALGAHPLHYAVAQLVLQVASASYMFTRLHRLAPWIFGNRVRISGVLLKPVLKPALATLSLPISQALAFEGPRLIVGALLGPVSVVIFVAHRQLARLLMALHALQAPFQAEMTIAHANGDHTAYELLTFKSMQLMGWCLLVASIGVFAMGRPAFLAWTHHALAYSSALLALCILATFFEVFWRVAMAPLLAVNRQGRLALIYLALAVVLQGAVIVGIRLGGLVGGASAIVLLDLTVLMAAGVLVSRHFNISLTDFMTRGLALPTWLVGELRRVRSR